MNKCKLLHVATIAISAALLCYSPSSSALFEQQQSPQGLANASLEKLLKYVRNFAKYYNIDVEKEPDQKDQASPNINLIQQYNKNLISNRSAGQPLPQNILLNHVFRIGNVPFRNDKVDVAPGAPTPTFQAIENYLLTPQNEEDCSNGRCVTTDSVKQYAGSISISNLYSQQKGGGATFIGGIAVPTGGNRQINPNDEMLSLNALLGPLTYSTQATGGAGGGVSPGSSSPSGSSDFSPLAKAMNFVRFVSGQMTPFNLPLSQDFRQLQYIAQNDKDPKKRENARIEMTQFIAAQRAFAARASVAVSNLNAMAAARVPNPNSNKSQAELEYQMATWRLSGLPADPQNPQQGDWYQQMEKAPPTVVQRNMLYLLAEMNYQMYLQRLQNERMLATMSLLQLQNLLPFAQSELFLDTSEPGPRTPSTGPITLPGATPTGG